MQAACRSPCCICPVQHTGDVWNQPSLLWWKLFWELSSLHFGRPRLHSSLVTVAAWTALAYISFASSPMLCSCLTIPSPGAKNSDTSFCVKTWFCRNTASQTLFGLCLLKQNKYIIFPSKPKQIQSREEVTKLTHSLTQNLINYLKNQNMGKGQIWFFGPSLSWKIGLGTCQGVDTGELGGAGVYLSLNPRCSHTANDYKMGWMYVLPNTTQGKCHKAWVAVCQAVLINSFNSLKLEEVFCPHLLVAFPEKAVYQGWLGVHRTLQHVAMVCSSWELTGSAGAAEDQEPQRTMASAKEALMVSGREFCNPQHFAHKNCR